MSTLVISTKEEVIDFLAKLENLKLFLVEKDGDLVLRGRNNKLSETDILQIKQDQSIVSFIRENKSSLLEYLRQLPTPAESGKLNLDAVASIYELSPLQEGMMFHDLYDGSANTYTEQFRVDFPNGLDGKVFRSSLNYLTGRHSILRSSFIYDKLSVPVQCVHRKVEIPIEELDLSSLQGAERDECIEKFIDEDRKRGFDFSQPPLMRITLINIGNGALKMIWTYNHILIDGWSLMVLVEELLYAYETISSGRLIPEQEEDRYEEFIKYIQLRDKDEDRKFWEGYMQGFENPTLLPFVGNQTERTKGRGIAREISLGFDEGFTRQLTQFIQSRQITASTLMQGIWSILLSKYTGSAETTCGVTVSGRPIDLKDAEQRVGLYINALPLRAKPDPELEITEWLQALQKSHTQAREYQYSALSDIQKWSGAESNLFDTILIFEKYPMGELLSKNWKLQVDNVHSKTQNNYSLSIKVAVGRSINIVFSYYNDLLDDAYAEMIRSHIDNLFKQIVLEGRSRIGQLDLLGAEERQILTTGFNQYRVAYPENETVVDRLQNNAAAFPNQTATVFNGRCLTYAQLNAEANRLANYLLAAGLEKGKPVAVCMDQQMELLPVAIYGILKTGSPYLPIDPALPEDRLAYILEETGARILLTHSGCALQSGNLQDTLVAELDTLDLSNASDANPATTPNAADLLYIIYTSGSTGKPKGVMVNHGNLTDYLYGFFSRVSMPAHSSFGIMSTVATDLGNTVLFGALHNAGSLHFFTKDMVSDPNFLHEYFSTNQVDCIKIVPSHWRALESNGAPLLPAHTIVFGGEQLTTKILEKINASGKPLQVVNHYGPTETTIGKLLHRVDLNHNYSLVPIGQVFSNSTTYVVDANLELCPLGVFGELLIGGAGVSDGYLNRADLNAEKFIPDTFCKKGGKLYRTGDTVRRLPNGEIEFAGRKDNQVKIRGYRIELGEVETIIQQSPLVSQCVVMAREDANGDKSLVAYIVPAGAYDAEAVQQYLKAQLPVFMVPSVIVPLTQLPLTAVGKIDRKALPDPESAGAEEVAFTAPRNEVEEKLAAIWKEVLKLETVSIDGDFFDHGGHSLSAIRLIGKINKAFGVKMAIANIFKYPTIRLQAENCFAQKTDNDELKLILINKGKGGNPVFLVPGSTGNPLVYEKLGKTAGNNVPVYSFQPRGFGGTQQPLDTMEALAKTFIAEMKKLQPAGPYRIGGYSFGGALAYEMALQLAEEGTEVSELIIMDTPSPRTPQNEATSLPFAEWLLYTVGFYAKYYGVNISLGAAELEGLDQEAQISLLYTKLKKSGVEITPEQLKGYLNVNRACENARRVYQPENKAQLNIPVAVFRCMEISVEMKQHFGDAVFAQDDLGWNELTTGTVRYFHIEGNHQRFLMDSGADAVIEHLNNQS